MANDKHPSKFSSGQSGFQSKSKDASQDKARNLGRWLGYLVAVVVILVLGYFLSRIKNGRGEDSFSENGFFGAAIGGNGESEKPDLAALEDQLSDQQVSLKPSEIALENGVTAKGIGYGAVLLRQFKTDNGDLWALFESAPCVECDAPSDLVVFSSELKGEVKLPLPGRYFYGDSKDPDQIVYGFAGNCSARKDVGGSARSSVVILQKYKEDDGPWKAERIEYWVEGQKWQHQVEKKEVHLLESEIKSIEGLSNCQKIQEKNQSYL